jgi:transposase-like protein
MQHFKSTSPSRIDVERPPCPSCSAQMWLTRITPYEPGYDQRTFECAGCQYEHEVVVKYG